MEMTNVILDTNLLYESGKNEIKNYREFELSSNFDFIINFLETNDISDKYKVWVPEIVFMELEKQRKEKYKASIDNIKKEFEKIKEFKNVELKLPEVCYEEEIVQYIRNYIKKYKINVLKIIRDEQLFERILERCVNKKKPFCGVSDKGFKDVVLWESIISYANTNQNNEKFALITNNSNDFIKNLEKEFLDRTGKEITIYYKIKDFQESIVEINEIDSRIPLNNSIIESENESGELIDKINRFILENEEIKIEKLETEDIKYKLKIQDIVDMGNREYNIRILYIAIEYLNKQEICREFDIKIIVKENEGIIIQNITEIQCV